MNLKTIYIGLIALVFNYNTNANNNENTESKILDDESIEKLSTNQFIFVEGPAWDGNNNVYFTDITGQKIYKYDTTAETFTSILSNSGRANGLMFNNKNNLVVCHTNEHDLSEYTTEGAFVKTLASTFNDEDFNSPNDLCIDKDGGIYFTDPNFFNFNNQSVRVYYRKNDGTIISVIDDLEAPNGIILSNDGTKIFIANTFSNIITSYDVNNDGSLSSSTNFATLQFDPVIPEGENTGADGMTIDVNGNLYIACKNGIQVFDNTGSHIETIELPERPTNCTFGGSDMKTLFVTAQKNLYAITGDIAGFRHPFDLPGFTLSIKENTISNKNLVIYPNPTQDTLNIKNVENYNSVEIFNSIGAKVLSSKAIEIIDISSLTNGIYNVQLANNTGTIETIKIIISK